MSTLTELAALVGGDFPSEHGSLILTGPAALADALEGEISFFGHPRYATDLRTTRASVVLVPRDFSGETSAVCLRVDNPSAAFTLITQEFVPAPELPLPGVHASAVVASTASVSAGATVQPQAVIEDGAIIGDGSVIGAGCFIGRGVRIGSGCLLHPHVVIREACVLGDRVILHSGVVIGADGFGYDTRDGKHHKIPQSGNVVVENDVEIGANTTVDRARFGRTVIGEGTKIDNTVMIAHNVVIGRHCIICAQVGISGSARINDYVVLAGQVGVVGHITIGAGSIIGAQAGVSNDIDPKSILVGSPPRPIGEWKRTVVRIDRLGQLYDRVKKLETKLGAD
jgi:UDP-3-O-[3-hydroxymyristoyl] glucosamine N-acyltransferase